MPTQLKAMSIALQQKLLLMLPEAEHEPDNRCLVVCCCYQQSESTAICIVTTDMSPELTEFDTRVPTADITLGLQLPAVSGVLCQ